jgi:hypothetical protein
LSAYLEVGGDVYMEGADCWNYDPYSDIYMNLFGLDGSEDGTNDLLQVVGIPGTLGHAMSFPYSGENAFMDELVPAPGAQAFMRNPADDQFHAVSNQENARRTIACSFEFGGLDDADEPSTKRELLLRYAQFFELPVDYPTLSVARGPGPTEVTLSWHGGQPTYTVYRSHDPSDVVNPGHLIGTTDGLSWTDDPPEDGLQCYIVKGS